MDYEAPAVELVGSATELIKAHLGPQTDGGGWSFSQGLICSPLEDE